MTNTGISIVPFVEQPVDDVVMEEIDLDNEEQDDYSKSISLISSDNIAIDIPYKAATVSCLLRNLIEGTVRKKAIVNVQIP